MLSEQPKVTQHRQSFLPTVCPRSDAGTFSIETEGSSLNTRLVFQFYILATLPLPLSQKSHRLRLSWTCRRSCPLGGPQK